MNKRDAYRAGIDSGYEAGQYGEFTTAEIADEDSFASACFEICENKRQFADSITHDLAKEPNSESLFDSFDAGETVGVRKAWKDLFAKDAAKREALEFALSPDFDGLKVNDLADVPPEYRGEVLHVSDHGNPTLYAKTSKTRFREIASCV